MDPKVMKYPTKVTHPSIGQDGKMITTGTLVFPAIAGKFRRFEFIVHLILVVIEFFPLGCDQLFPRFSTEDTPSPSDGIPGFL